MIFNVIDHVIKVGDGLKTALGVCDSNDRSMKKGVLFLYEKMMEKAAKIGVKKGAFF